MFAIVQWCGTLYVGTVIPNSTFGSLCFSAADIAAARTYTSAVRANWAGDVNGMDKKNPILARYPAWAAEKRPASAMNQLLNTWKVPLHQLRDAIAEHLENVRNMQQLHSSNTHVWCGQRVQLSLVISASSTEADASAASTNIELQMQAVNLPTIAVCSIDSSMYILSAPNSWQSNSFVRNVAQEYFAREDVASGVATTFSPLSSWDEAESQLRASGLVHPDDCVHVRVCL